MKHQLLKVTAALGFAVFAVFALNAYAQQGGKGMAMGNMKMNCSKNMGDMKGMKGMDDMKGMDCMNQGLAKATSLTDGEVKNVDAKAGRSGHLEARTHRKHEDAANDHGLPGARPVSTFEPEGRKQGEVCA